MNKRNLRKRIGFIFLAITVLCWIGAPIIPFTNISNKVVITTAVVITGELFFVLTLALLGKEYWNKIKKGFKRLFTIKQSVESEIESTDFQE